MLNELTSNRLFRPEQIQDHLDLEKKSFFIVSDELPELEKVLRVAERLMFQVIAVHDAEEALQVFEFHTPSAVLVDLDCLGMSGKALLDHLQSSQFSQVPVHVISNWKGNPQALKPIQNLLERDFSKKASQPTGPERELFERFQEKTVLIVEKDISSVFELNNQFTSLKMNVLIARSLIEARLQIEENPSVDLVFLDFEFSPSEMLEWMRSLKRKFPNLPILLLVPESEQNPTPASGLAGSPIVLRKPLREGDLNLALRKIFPQ